VPLVPTGLPRLWLGLDPAVPSGDSSGMSVARCRPWPAGSQWSWVVWAWNWVAIGGTGHPGRTGCGR